MQGALDSIRWVRHVGQAGLIAVVYFAAAKASLLLAIPPGYATAVWPPSGIALAAILILGQRVWPGIWLGAALANLTVASSFLAAVAVASGNALEALAGAELIRRYIAAGPPYFDSVRKVVKFVAFAPLCAAVAATIGVMSLALAGAVPWTEFPSNWGTWWHGDTAGIIIVTPLILNWRLRYDVVWSPAKIGEAAAFSASLLLIAYLVFGTGGRTFASLPLTFMILPLVIWAAFRFSRREVTTAVAAVCAIAVWYTVEDVGPFALGSLNLSLTMLLAFVSTIVTTGLVLSAVVEERSRAMDKLALALRDLREQASTDPLTGLANRRFLWDFLQREWIRARRRGSSLAVVMIDLDRFKPVNDTFGHDAGDHVLIEIAELLRRHVRGSDIACRFGGEEFALVLPDASLEAVQRRADAIRSAVQRLEPNHRGRRLGRITASFGVALHPDHAEDPESLLRAADEALYRAKATGRDRVVVSAAGAGGSRLMPGA